MDLMEFEVFYFYFLQKVPELLLHYYWFEIEPESNLLRQCVRDSGLFEWKLLMENKLRMQHMHL